MSRRAMVAEDLLRFLFLGDPRLSPDGETVLYGHKVIEGNKYVTQLETVEVGTGVVRRLTHGEKSSSSGRWSPDGESILFLSPRKDDLTQLYRLPLNGGEAERLTDLPEGAWGRFVISPDARKVAFTFRETVTEHTNKAAEERKAENGSTPPWVSDEAWHRLDGDGYFGAARHKLMLLDLDSREVRTLSEASTMGRYDFSWTPDSKSLVVTRSRESDPMRMPPNDGLFLVSLDGVETEIPVPTKGDKDAPRVSQCGEWIAFAGDESEDDPWGTRNTRVYLVPFAGGAPRDLTGATDHDVAVATLADAGEATFGANLEWAPDGSGLYVQVGTKGESQIGWVPKEGGLELLTSGHHVISMGNVIGDRVAALRSDVTHLPEIGVVEKELATGQSVFKQLTDANRGLYEEVEPASPEEMWLDAEDGAKVHTWVLKPSGGVDPKRVVVQVHGGPHTQYGWALFHEFQTLVGQGFTVVYGNPRGSKGYGEAWTAAIKGDWGHKDWIDVQAIVAKARELAKGGQIAIAGGSYGGYMTNWAIGHDRESFACAVSDRCVSNMVSMALNSDFPFNKDGYFKGTAYGDLNEISELWRQSPISHFEGVKTPTLVIHSEGDLRCNVEQGDQVFLALRMQGTPARMVRYPASTSHGMSRMGPPDLRLHRLSQIVEWFDKYM